MAACGAKGNAEEEKSDNPFATFNGVWKLTKNENSGEYLTGRGVGMIQRNLFKAINVTMTVKAGQDKDKKDCITLAVEATGGKKGTYEYTDGCTLACKGLQGDDQSRVCKLDGGKMQVTTTWTGDKPQFTKPETRSWTVDGDTLTIVVTAKDKDDKDITPMTQVFTKQS